MNSQHNRSSGDYQKEAEVTRYRLAQHLDELSDRLTPGQVFDEMLTYAKGGSGTFLRALTNASRENPIPSLLIGAGCMLFLSEKMGLNRYLSRGDGARAGGDGAVGSSMGAATEEAMSDAASRVGGAASKAKQAAGSAAESIGSGVRRTTDFASDRASDVAEGVRHGAAAVGDTISQAGRSARATARQLGNQASSAADQVKETAQNLAGTVQDYSSSIGGQVADTAGHAQRQATRAARQAKDTAASFVNEQPLLCAAVGLAVGAAIAAMLPSTAAEDELMGESSDAVKDTIGKVASDHMQTAKATAGKVVQEAKNVAEKEGLTASGAADAARNLGEKLKKVVTETGAVAGNEMSDFTEQSDAKRNFAKADDGFGKMRDKG